MEESMTDYQYKTIIKMVIKIVKRCNSIEQILKELEDLLKK